MTETTETQPSYEPTRREIYQEMERGFWSLMTKELITPEVKKAASNSLTSLIESAKTMESVFLVLNITPYIIPTGVREIKDMRINDGSPPKKLTVSEKIGFTTGLITGFTGDLVQLGLYSALVATNHPEALLIPFTTNLASGAYEIGRKGYRNARERLIEKQEGKK